MALTKPALYTPVPLETLAEADHQEGLHETDRTTIRDLCDEIGVPAANGTHLPYVRLGDGASSGLWVPAHVLAADNPILNGGFRGWPQGTSFAAITSGVYAADHWLWSASNDGSHTVQRAADVPAVAATMPYDSYSLHIDCTTADASIGASQYASILTYVEGYSFAPYAQRTFTLSFWVKATKTGTYCVAFRNSGADRTYVGEYTVSASDTWEFKSIQVSASPTAGTWDYTTGVGISVRFTLAVGSTLQTTAGAWQTGNYMGTSNQVNALDSASNDFKLYGVRITPGNAPAMFVPRHPALEESLLRRYFQVREAGSANTVFGSGRVTNSTSAEIALQYSPMRTSPTVTFSAAGHFEIDDATVQTCTVLAGDLIGPSSCRLSATVASGLTTGRGCLIRAASTTSAKIYLAARF